MDIYTQGSTTEEKTTEKMKNQETKSNLTSMGNEISVLLMDTTLINEDKQTANEVLSAVQLAKEGMTQEIMEADGKTLNNAIADDGERENKVEQGPIAEQLGVQQGLKINATDTSFAVQEVPVPKAPAPAHRRSGFFRFIKGVVAFFTGCMVVQKYTKWKHAERSNAALVAARQRAAALEQQVVRAPDREGTQPEAEDQPELKEAQAQANEENFTTDLTKAPAVWEEALGFGRQDPKLELHAHQGASAGLRTEADARHSFLVLRYSKEDYRTGKVRKYRLAFGFGQRFFVDATIQYGLQATVPGHLMDERNNSSTTGRSYDITNEKVSAIIEAAPKEAQKGYNAFKHNCSTFVVDMLGVAGISDNRVQEEYLNLENAELKMPSALKKGVNKLGDMRATLLRRMGSEDVSYARRGEKLVSLEDIERFENSLDFDLTEVVGYAPGMLGEQLRSSNADDGDAGRAVAVLDFDEFNDKTYAKGVHGVLSNYEKGPYAEKVTGIKENAIDPMNALISKLIAMRMPPPDTQSAKGKQEYAEFKRMRTEFLADTTGFETTKEQINSYIRQWLPDIDRQKSRGLHTLGYTLLGRMAGVEIEYYEQYNNHSSATLGDKQDEKELYSILEPSNVFSMEVKNPLFIKSFGKVFGDMSYEDYLARTNELEHMPKTAERNRQLGMMSKKFGTVASVFSVEQYKFMQFAKQLDFTQQQMDGVFADKPGTDKSNEKAQDAYATVIFYSLFADAKSRLLSEISDYTLVPASKGSKNMVVSSEDCCSLSEMMMRMVANNLNNLYDNTFEGVVRAIARGNGGTNKSKSEVCNVLLDHLFNKFFVAVTEGTPTSTRFIQGVADPSTIPSRARETDAGKRLLQKREELIAKLEAVAQRVLDKM